MNENLNNLKYATGVVNGNYSDELIDGIIDYTAADISLSESDVKDLAIYTLYSIVVLGNDPVAAPYIKKSLADIIGDSAKTIDYLNNSLAGISATNDAIADELNADEFERLEKEQLEMV